MAAFSHHTRVRNCKILIGIWKLKFMNGPIIYLDRENNTKLVSASFTCFLEFS